MPPSNSTRKVAKAARSTSARRAASSRKNRSVSFPVAMGVIVLIGLLVIFWGRERRIAASDAMPRVNRDHWHAAYGIFICDKFIPNLLDARGDARGVHTHDDGIIHIHPYTSAAAGKNANLSTFFYETKLTVADGKIQQPPNADGSPGETWTDGKQCPDSRPGKVVLAVWDNADAKDAKPTIVTHDIPGVRFKQDRMAFTLAFVPDDKVATLPKPDSVPTLDNLSDVPGGSTTATAPATGDSSTTAPGTPADQSTTTAPGSSTTAASGSTSPPAPASSTTAGR